MFLAGSVSGASGQMGFLALPPSTKSVYLQGSASGIQWRMAVASGSFQGVTAFASGYSGLSFVGTGSMAYLDGPALVSGPFRTLSNPVQSTTVVAILNPGMGACSVLVFTSPTS